MTSGTIQTTIHTNHRVSFSCPPEGYCLDDLDALVMAICHARSQLTTEDIAAPTHARDLTDAFHQQQSRLAAPS